MSSKDASAMGGEHNEKPVLVPRLRFPEFREAEEWKVRELGGLCRIRTGKKDANEGCENGLYPFFTCAERHIFSNTYSFDAEAILIAGNANVGQAKYYKGKFEAYQRTYVLTNFAQVSVPYLYLYLSSQLSEALARQVQTSAMSYIKLPMLETYKVPSPRAPAEQQKIADCLSSLDELITAETQKLDALKTHKKGLMQQLFPREGEAVPWLRFPEFREAGEWDTKRLDNIGRVIRGASPRPKDDPRYYGGPVPRLMVQDVTRDGKWVTPQIDSLTLEGAKLSRPCPAGTLTIVCSGSVGVVSFLAVDACIHDGFLALIDIDESIVSKDFLYHCLSTLREQFEKGATHGGVFTNLTTSGIELFEISCPNTLEQQRISDCLSSLDEIITVQSQKIDALKAHKKGLMQQLFPVLGEVPA